MNSLPHEPTDATPNPRIERMEKLLIGLRPEVAEFVRARVASAPAPHKVRAAARSYECFKAALAKISGMAVLEVPHLEDQAINAFCAGTGIEDEDQEGDE